MRYDRYECAYCHRVRRDDGINSASPTRRVAFCQECAEDAEQIHALYLQIVRARPEYKTLAPIDLFRKMWAYVQRVSPKRDNPKPPEVELQPERDDYKEWL